MLDPEFRSLVSEQQSISTVYGEKYVHINTLINFLRHTLFLLKLTGSLSRCPFVFCTFTVAWRCSVRVGYGEEDLGLTAAWALQHNDLGQIVHTIESLWSGHTTWYLYKNQKNNGKLSKSCGPSSITLDRPTADSTLWRGNNCCSCMSQELWDSDANCVPFWPYVIWHVYSKSCCRCSGLLATQGAWVHMSFCVLCGYCDDAVDSVDCVQDTT